MREVVEICFPFPRSGEAIFEKASFSWHHFQLGLPARGVYGAMRSEGKSRQRKEPP